MSDGKGCWTAARKGIQIRQAVIVGGGFTGAAAAIDLARRSAVPLDIRIVEPRAVLGGGVAYSTPHPDHRLNGTPGIHAIYLDDPLHFRTWLDTSGTAAADPQAIRAGGAIYARRRDFGRYMAEQLALQSSINPSGSRIEHVRESAIRIGGSADKPKVHLSNGTTLAADYVILGLGWNAIGVPGPFSAVQQSPAWLGSPWDLDRISAIPRDAPVLLIGAGLTAADTFAALVAQGHQGSVTALSRRGLRSASQTPFQMRVSVWERLMDPEPDFLRKHGRPQNVRSTLRALRHDIAAIDPASASWHIPFDDLRDSVTHFWPTMPLAEKRRFVQHLKSWYDAFRFRNPPQTEDIVNEGIRRGQLNFVSGRLQAARRSSTGLEVGYWERMSGAPRLLKVGAAINCTGPHPLPSGSGNPLWRALLADGLARDHPCGIGVDVDPSCHLLDLQGRPHQRILVVGPPTAGCFGEAAAVPYIARQIFETTDRVFRK